MTIGLLLKNTSVRSQNISLERADGLRVKPTRATPHGSKMSLSRSVSLITRNRIRPEQRFKVSLKLWRTFKFTTQSRVACKSSTISRRLKQDFATWLELWLSKSRS